MHLQAKPESVPEKRLEEVESLSKSLEVLPYFYQEISLAKIELLHKDGDLPYFYRKISLAKIQSLMHKDGDFLVQMIDEASDCKTKERLSGQMLVLSVMCGDEESGRKIRHWLIQQDIGKFGIENTTFSSLPAMVDYHVSSQKSILGEENVLLKNAIHCENSVHQVGEKTATFQPIALDEDCLEDTQQAPSLTCLKSEASSVAKPKLLGSTNSFENFAFPDTMTTTVAIADEGFFESHKDEESTEAEVDEMHPKNDCFNEVDMELDAMVSTPPLFKCIDQLDNKYERLTHDVVKQVQEENVPIDGIACDFTVLNYGKYANDDIYMGIDDMCSDIYENPSLTIRSLSSVSTIYNAPVFNSFDGKNLDDTLGEPDSSDKKDHSLPTNSSTSWPCLRMFNSKEGSISTNEMKIDSSGWLNSRPSSANTVNSEASTSSGVKKQISFLMSWENILKSQCMMHPLTFDELDKLNLRDAISKTSSFYEFIQLYSALDRDSGALTISKIIRFAELLFNDYQQHLLDELQTQN